MFLNRHLRQGVAAIPSYSLANSFEQRAAAFRLIYQSYLSSGLGTCNPLRLRVTPFQLLATSQIFLASIPTSIPNELEKWDAFVHPEEFEPTSRSGLQEQVVATITLVNDGQLGLPMEGIFGREVQLLRREGRQIAEVTCLATSTTDARKFLQIFTQLTRILAQFSRYEGAQNLLISVHPRHAKFYSRYFGFRPLSNRVALCPHVKDKPAVALNLNFDLYDLEQPQSWHAIFGTWEPQEELQPTVIPSSECALWREVSKVSCAELTPLLMRIDPNLEEERRSRHVPETIPITFPGFRRRAA